MNANDNQEIDLVELLANLYRSILKNWIPAIILPLAGIILAVSINSAVKDTLQSNMLIATDLLSKEECEFLFEELEKADTFPKLTSDQMKLVNKISFTVLDKKDANDKNVYLKVTAKVHSLKIFPILEKAVVSYLNECEPVTMNRRDKELITNGLIQKIEIEESGLDKVKERQIQDNEKATSYLSPADLFETSLELREKKIKYQIENENLKSVRVVKGFGSLTKNAKLSPILAGLIGFALGLMAFFFLLFLMFFKRYLDKTRQAS